MIHSNKCFPYKGPHKHGDDTINNFFYSVKSKNGTTFVELTVGTKKPPTDVYAIGSKSDLNIYKVLQERFHKRGITINIWSKNPQR